VFGGEGLNLQKNRQHDQQNHARVSSADPGIPICSYEGSDYRTAFWGQGRDYEVILIDYARSLLEEARERLGGGPRFRYVVADVYNLPLVEDAVDAILMVRVLHHLQDVPCALEELSRVLCGGGSAVLEYANKRNIKAIARRALRRQDWSPFSPEPWEFVELNYNFHPDWMQDRLRESGFLIERERAVSYFRLGALKKAVPARALAALDGWFQPTARWGPYSPSVFVRARALAGGPLAGDVLFRCPACGGSPLEEGKEACRCAQCGRAWPIENGIHILKTAEVSEASGYPEGRCTMSSLWKRSASPVLPAVLPLP